MAEHWRGGYPGAGPVEKPATPFPDLIEIGGTMKRKQKRTFEVTVTWEATAELVVRAHSAEEAETIARDRGLPWKKAVEGDDGHYWLDVEEITEDRAPPKGRNVHAPAAT